MSDLSQTAANVKLMSATQPTVGTAGEALTQGQPVYLSASKWYRCDANDGVAKAACGGIVLTPNAADLPVVIAPNNATVDLGATLAIGTTYGISATVGGVCPIADITSTQFPTVLGTATAVNKLPLSIIVGTVAKA